MSAFAANTNTAAALEILTKTPADFRNNDDVEAQIPPAATLEDSPLGDAFYAAVRSVKIPNTSTLFVPVVPKYFTQEFVCYVFQGIGVISRVDFVQIKNFDTKEIDPRNKRVFIHFAAVYDTAYTQELFKGLDTCPHVEIHAPDMIRGGIIYKFKVMRAKQVVPTTELNIHQIAHVQNILDDKILDLERENARKEERIARLEELVTTLGATVDKVSVSLSESVSKLAATVTKLAETMTRQHRDEIDDLCDAVAAMKL